MTKKNFKPPTLQHKNKWSPNFHDFLVQALKKDPRSRPTAHELLKVLTLLAITIVSYYCKCALLSDGPFYCLPPLLSMSLSIGLLSLVF